MILGTPTSPTVGGLEPELVTIAAYDSTGTAATMIYELTIGNDPAVLFPGPIDDMATTSQADSGINILVINNDYVPGNFPFPRFNITPVINLPGLLQPHNGTIQTSGDPTMKQTTNFYQPNQDFVGTDTLTIPRRKPEVESRPSTTIMRERSRPLRRSSSKRSSREIV